MKLYKIQKSRIDNKGRGLYATKDIKEGTRIINYKGKDADKFFEQTISLADLGWVFVQK